MRPRQRAGTVPGATDDEALERALRYLGYFRALSESAKALTSTLELDQVLQVIMRSVSQLLAPENWSLMLLDAKSNELYFAIAVGDAADRIRQCACRRARGWRGGSLSIAGPSSCPGPTRIHASAGAWTRRSSFHTGSIVCVPLVFADQVLGVIEMVNRADATPYGEEDLGILSPFADFAAIAIANARNFQRAQELTLVDEWTSLYNARYLRSYLDEEVQRGYRYHHPVSLAFMDLDHFKDVNDAHGHETGSGLLRAMGETIWKVVRVADRPVRYGGDEFVVVMPETSKPGALALAERLRQAVTETQLVTAGGVAVRVTASVGVATFPDDAGDPGRLLSAADRAMYLAKAQGRDTVRDARDLGVPAEAAEG